jgi:saccharopine dehydrogenase-like NADP-dependent oxidoreductase
LGLRLSMSEHKIIVLGAGRSSKWLVNWLEAQADVGGIVLQIVDGVLPAYALRSNTEFLLREIDASFDFERLLADAFICVSLLPPNLHLGAMRACVYTGTHFLSASYETAEARALDAAAIEKGILILNECGFDPGFDHVTALAMIAQVHAWGGHIQSFESDSGGLPAITDLNDWGYRFFWNPANVVSAGLLGARFKERGQDLLISYPEVFRHYRLIGNEGSRELVAYPNRDSLNYQVAYELPNAETFVRGTIRYQHFCDRWAAFAEANVASATAVFAADCTFEKWAGHFRWHARAHEMLLDLITEANFGDKILGQPMYSYDVLLKLLTACWNPGQGYTDRILMRHRIIYELDGNRHAYVGTLDLEGTPAATAMAHMVGLPLAIVVELLGKERLSGVRTPIDSILWPRIYQNLPNHNINLIHENLPLKP